MDGGVVISTKKLSLLPLDDGAFTKKTSFPSPGGWSRLYVCESISHDPWVSSTQGYQKIAKFYCDMKSISLNIYQG